MSSIKEAIKAEIERLYNGEAPKHDQQCEFEDGYFTGIATISKFINSLPDECLADKRKTSDEPVIDSHGLEEEIQGMYQAIFGTDIINRREMVYLETFDMIARHFAEWGRMRFRDTEKSQNEISDNIGHLMKKKAAQAYVAQLVLNGKAPDGLTISPLREIAENAFIYGAEWGAKHLK